MPLPSEKLRELVDEQVSTRSPRPDRPASVSRRAPAGQAEARHFGKAARDQRGARILAEPRALDDAAGDREHVLDRAADLRADDVVETIGPESRAGRSGREAPRRAPASSHARVTAVGRPAATSCAKVGPDSTAIGASGCASRATSDISRRVPASIPFAQRTSACRPTGAVASTARMCCAGVTTSNASQPPRSARSPVARIAGRSGRPAGRRCSRGRALIASTTSGSRAQSSTSRPPRARDLRQRRAPGAAADDADRSCLHPRAAHLLGAGSSGQRARAGASSGSVSPAAETLGAGPGDHRGIVGAEPSGGATKRQAMLAGELLQARRGSRWLAATPPATTSAVAPLRCQARAGCGRPGNRRPPAGSEAAISARRQLPGVARAQHRALEPGEREMRLARADQRARQRHCRGRPRAAAPRPPGRRESRGRAAWRSCRTLRPPHRRSWSRAGDSRPTPSHHAATGNGRPRRAAADRESRGPDRPAAGSAHGLRDG